MCAILALGLVLRYDLYNREPWFMVLAAVGLGALVMWPMGKLEIWSLETLGLHERAPVGGLAAVAATHEEAARLIIVAMLALFVPRHFDDPMDGLIYGSLVALGMAVEESISFLGRDDVGMLPGSEVIRLAGHIVMGGIGSVAIGMARMRLPRWPVWLVVTFGFSVALHFAWDCLALGAMVRDGMELGERLLSVALMVSGLFAYGVLVVLASDWSRRHFAPHDPRRVWGWPMSVWVKRS